MDYSCLMRVEKLHSLEEVAGAAAHNSRQSPPKHANSNVTNQVLLGGNNSVVARLTARLQKCKIKLELKKARPTKKKTRARILALNILFIVGEAFFEKVDPCHWGERCLELLYELFGRENVLSAELHLDERNPHVQAIVVPITPDGMLSANAIFCANRNDEPEDMNGTRRGNPTKPFFESLQRQFFVLCKSMNPAINEPVPGGVMTHELVALHRDWANKAYQTMPNPPEIEIRPPTITDRLHPEDYALEQVKDYKRKAIEVIATIHSKAMQFDEQLRSNRHMQATLKKMAREIEQLKSQSLEKQQACHQLQRQNTDLSVHEICGRIGLPIDSEEDRHFTILPDGQKLVVPTAKQNGYQVQSWNNESSLDFVARILKLPNTEAAKTLLLAILTPDESEQVLAYHQRRQLHLQMEKKAIRLEWEALKTIAQLAPCDRRDEIRVLDRLETNFGIQYSIVQGFRKSFSISPTQQDNLALFRFSVKAQTGGILVVGSKFQSDGMLFEQHLGTFQLEPLVIDLPKPQSTIIVSNAIEALSLLSVRDLSKTLRVIVTGQAKPENVVRQALASPVPIILVEYQRGARCGRHRRLRELLLKDLDQINQLCPSDLRLGTPGFETIALQTEKVPKLANALCDLIGVRPIPPPEVVDPPDNPYVSF